MSSTKPWRTLRHDGVIKEFITEEDCRAWAADEALVTHGVVLIENWTPGGEDDPLNRGWGMVGSVPPVRKTVQPKIELLHVRDPDSGCVIRIWINGVETTDFIEDGVDPGAGYVLAEWDADTAEYATRTDYSPNFWAAAVDARNEARNSEYMERE